jgi:hypothetical protein
MGTHGETFGKVALRSVRNVYGPDAELRKQAALKLLEKNPPDKAKALVEHHEDLLFIRAFPGDQKTLRMAKAALSRFGTVVAKLPRDQRAAFDDSGVNGSSTRHIFPLPIVKWLVDRAAAQVEIDWREYHEPHRLDSVLRAFLRISEREGFESGEFNTREWIRLAKQAGPSSDLQWVVDALYAAFPNGQLADDFWAGAETPIVWNPVASKWSVTENHLRNRPVVLRRGMRRPQGATTARIAKRLRGIELLKPSDAKRVIDVTRAALTARCREVHAITYPNQREVYWCDLGEGSALAVIGCRHEFRQPGLEANYGYLLLSNGTPIGYGGVTALYRQANTGINIFDPFRGGEAAFLWTEMLRAFHSLFGVKRFVINGYQFGEGNAEAIASGAYWFYYRLGFRPTSTKLQKIAENEARRMSKPGAERSSRSKLRDLARGDLVLDLPGFDPRDAIDEDMVPRMGALMAQSLAAADTPSRAAAERQIARRVAELLGVADELCQWTKKEREAFELLAPLVSAIDGVGNWSVADRRGLSAMMRAKGAPQERDFALAASRNSRFFQSLAVALEAFSRGRRVTRN